MDNDGVSKVIGIGDVAKRNTVVAKRSQICSRYSL